MKPTQVNFLLRPWKTFKDGTLFYGTSKNGSKRHPLTSKQGNKNYYKGTRSSGIGSHTAYGKYTITWDKVRTYVVPAGLSNTDVSFLIISSGVSDILTSTVYAICLSDRSFSEAHL